MQGTKSYIGWTILIATPVLSPSGQTHPLIKPTAYVALTTTNPGHTLLQAKWRAVFLFSSSTVRSAFPRYSRNSARERAKGVMPSLPSSSPPGSWPSHLHILCIPSAEGEMTKDMPPVSCAPQAGLPHPAETQGGAPPFHTRPLHTHSSSLAVLGRRHERSAASVVSGVHLGLMLQ